VRALAINIHVVATDAALNNILIRRLQILVDQQAAFETQLKAITSVHQQLTDIGTCSRLNSPYLECELYLDQGEGFHEENKLNSRMALDNDNATILYDLPRFSCNLRRVRF